MATAKDKGTVSLIEQAATKAQEFEGITTDVLASAEQFEIVTQDQYVGSADLLKQIKKRASDLDDLRKSLTRPLDEAKTRIMDLFRPAGDRLAQAEQTLKNAMIVFTREQERIRREEEALAREEAAKETERLDRK